MSPLNRGGPLLGPRMPPAGMRPRFGARPPMPGMPPRMPPPMGPMFGPMRQRMMPPRPGGIMRPGGPPPLFGPRGRGVPPLMPPMMCPRGMGPRGPPMRPGLRGLLPPQGLPHMRPRFPIGNGNITTKAINNAKKVSKLEELELKKPWMTDEIRGEIQKKNKLYAKAKKNKDAKEWNEFKDLRNKVTRMIRDAKNEYLMKNPEQAHIYDDDIEPYDQRDENYVSSEDEDSVHYCEVCDREFNTAELLDKHTETHKTCGIDGCTFSAHPKLVEKHISMQHCTGLYHRMKNLSTPEDINKWIAERKKKYPTKINIEQKHAEEIEKRERGEMIKETKSIPESKYAEKSVREKKRKVRKRKVQELKASPEPSVEFYRGLRPFAGTATLCHNGYDEEEIEQSVVNEFPAELDTVLTVSDFSGNISDEEESINSLPLAASSSNAPKAQPAKAEQSCLLTLVADYGSDSSDDEVPEQVPIKRIRTEVPLDKDSQFSEASLIEPTKNPQELPEESLAGLQNNPKQLSKESLVNLSKDSHKRIKDFSKSNERNARSTKTSAKQSHERRPIDKSPRNNLPNHRNKKRLMLLQRLLSRSIQHERNVICQCIKYISDNDFFQ